MKRQILIVNLLLLTVAAGLAFKLQADWKQAARRQTSLVAGSALTPAIDTGLPAPPKPGTGMEVVVANNIFFSDRNNELPKAVEKKAAPPEPILVGTINLGKTKLALLADAAQPGSMPRQVKEGDSFGGYVLTEVGDNQVTLDWEGTKKKVDVNTTPRPVAAPAGVATSSAVAAPSVASTASPFVSTPGPPPPPNTAQIIPGKQGPSDQLIPGTTSRMSYPGDPLPPGTIINGYIKVERSSPFGKEMWWGKIDQPKNERNPPR